MERRSWPWKKKSSDKAAVEKAAAVLDAAGASLTSGASQGGQENYKKPKYVQISVESYAHLSGLEEQVKKYEEQVKTYEDQVKTYEEQVQTYEEQVQTYEEQVQTYEEQVQGLRNQIKQLTEKLTEANSEIITKESLVKQHAKVGEDAIFGWEKAEAEALALKNHLESVTLSKLTAEDRASHLDGALKECMRQIRNLKEGHEHKLQEVILTKTKQCEKVKLDFEAKIAVLDQELLRYAAENDALSRSLRERSNMLIQIAEENSQAEAEIERLSSNIELCEREINSLKYEHHIISKELEIRNEEKNMSVRSAEVANKQYMEGVKKISKLEAECQRLRGLMRKKLPGPAAIAQMKLEVENFGKEYGETRLRSPVKPSSPGRDFTLENLQKFQKENEFLTERMLAMEEETKMLKEALAKRNGELQASRSMCADAASKLQHLEAQLQYHGQVRTPTECFSQQNASNPPSAASMSEDGIDDDMSCTKSSATPLPYELSHFKENENSEKSKKDENESHLELMDDFLEMEQMAISTDSNGASVSDGLNNKILDAEDSERLEVRTGKDIQVEQVPPSDLSSVNRGSVQDTHENLDRHSPDAVFDPEDTDVIVDNETSLSQVGKETAEVVQVISKDLADAISHIHAFVLFLGKEAMLSHETLSDGNELSQKIECFSVTFNNVQCSNASLIEFVLELSYVLANASELRFNVMGYKSTEGGFSSPDCIDKVALPENKASPKDSSEEIYQNGCSHMSDSEIPSDGNLITRYGSNILSCKFSLEEFEELKLEKDTLATELVGCNENLETTKSNLHETELLLVDAKSQLAYVQKLNSLAETQLKCMAESYRSLEKRAEELEAEVNLLREKTDTQENELNDEKRSNQDALAKCMDFQEQLKRHENCSVEKNQDRELVAATLKLTECQETIFLLSKQLKSFRPQKESMGSPGSDRNSPRCNEFTENEHASISRRLSLQDVDQDEMDMYHSPRSPSETERHALVRSPISSKHANHCHSRSSSSSSPSTPTSEKHSRGISRFFSAKSQNSH